MRVSVALIVKKIVGIGIKQPYKNGIFCHFCIFEMFECVHTLYKASDAKANVSYYIGNLRADNVKRSRQQPTSISHSGVARVSRHLQLYFTYSFL